jgi:hypothetical protein
MENGIEKTQRWQTLGFLVLRNDTNIFHILCLVIVYYNSGRKAMSF